MLSMLVSLSLLLKTAFMAAVVFMRLLWLYGLVFFGWVVMLVVVLVVGGVVEGVVVVVAAVGGAGVGAGD